MEKNQSISKTTVKAAPVNPDEQKSGGGKSMMKGCGCASISLVVVIFILGALIVGAMAAPSVGDRLSEIFQIDLDGDTVGIGDGDVGQDRDLNIVVTQEENRVIKVIDENMHSVVSIAVSEMSFSPQQGVIDNTSNIGSGFIVDPNGLIVTNQHVVSNLNADYQVITEDGTEYDVVEIVRDDFNDIAILKINATNLNAVDLGDSKALVQGQTVIAIGTPLGEYAGSVTTGVISGLSRSVTTSDGSFLGTVKSFEDVIQTDAAINPGNSGGPLLNSAGEVIGVNFATSAGADNISFALPINRVKTRLNEYRSYGKFIRPFVGVEYQMISEAEAMYYNDLAAGAFIRSIVDGSPAAAAGIQRGDIITKINGEAVEGSFVVMIQEYQVGDELDFEILRNGEYINLNVVLAEAD